MILHDTHPALDHIELGSVLVSHDSNNTRKYKVIGETRLSWLVRQQYEDGTLASHEPDKVAKDTLEIRTRARKGYNTPKARTVARDAFEAERSHLVSAIRASLGQYGNGDKHSVVMLRIAASALGCEVPPTTIPDDPNTPSEA